MMSITFSSGTHIQYDSGHKGRDLSGAAFMTRTRTHKYETVIFVMMSKGLTIDWMEFYISFTGLQIEEGK